MLSLAEVYIAHHVTGASAKIFAELDSVIGVALTAIDIVGAHVPGQHTDLHDAEPARAAPVLAGCDQSAPDAAPAQRFDDEQLGYIGMAPFLGDDEDVVFLLDDDAPANGLAGFVRGDKYL